MKLFKGFGRYPMTIGLWFARQQVNGNTGLNGGGFGGPGLEFVLGGSDPDLIAVRFGDIARLESCVRDIPFMVQVTGGFQENAHPITGENRGNIGFGNALIQNSPHIVKPGSGARSTCAGGTLAGLSFTANFQ